MTGLYLEIPIEGPFGNGKYVNKVMYDSRITKTMKCYLIECLNWNAIPSGGWISAEVVEEGAYRIVIPKVTEKTVVAVIFNEQGTDEYNYKEKKI